MKGKYVEPPASRRRLPALRASCIMAVSFPARIDYYLVDDVVVVVMNGYHRHTGHILLSQ